MTFQGLGTGIVLVSPRGGWMNYVLQLHFWDSNNASEYEALLHGLRIAASLGIRRLICHGDSDLVVQQVMTTFDSKDSKMAAYSLVEKPLSSMSKKRTLLVIG